LQRLFLPATASEILRRFGGTRVEVGPALFPKLTQPRRRRGGSARAKPA
jgi:hypothetical protein